MSDPPRRRARELVLKALYASDCGDVTPDADFSNVSDVGRLPARALDYAHRLYAVSYTHLRAHET